MQNFHSTCVFRVRESKTASKQIIEINTQAFYLVTGLLRDKRSSVADRSLLSTNDAN